MAEPKVTVEVTMTPELYVQLKKDASWYGKTVAEYMVAAATGWLSKGC